MQTEEYMLFAGSDYYPRGGFEDLVLVSTDMEALKSRFKEMTKEPLSYKWAHIVRRSDITVIKVVKRRGRHYSWLDASPYTWSTDWPEDLASSRYVEVEFRNGSRVTDQINMLDWQRYEKGSESGPLNLSYEIVRFRYASK